MEDEPELIRQRMEESRTSMGEKLEELEQKFVGVMGGATDAVTDTVETVKDSVASVTDAVQDTVQSIRETFDIQRQFERQPWLMFGGAVVVGLLGAKLFGSSRAAKSSAPSSAPSWSGPTPASAIAPPAKQRSVLLDGPLGDAAASLRGLALGAALGLLRDMAAEHLPEAIGKSIAETVDDLTTKVGGKKLPAHALLGPAEHGEEPKQEESGFGSRPSAFDDEALSGKPWSPVTSGR